MGAKLAQNGVNIATNFAAKFGCDFGAHFGAKIVARGAEKETKLS